MPLGVGKDIGRAPIPRPSFEDSPVPELTRKAELLGDVTTYEGVVTAINDAPFSTKTKQAMLLMASVAAGKELLMANHWGGVDLRNRGEFMCWMIEKEAMLPREDRELETYVDVDRAIKILYGLNITQSVQDRRGRNVFHNQYTDIKEQYAQVSDYRDEINQQQAPPTKKGFSIRGAAGRLIRGR